MLITRGAVAKKNKHFLPFLNGAGLYSDKTDAAYGKMVADAKAKILKAHPGKLSDRADSVYVQLAEHPRRASGLLTSMAVAILKCEGIWLGIVLLIAGLCFFGSG